jgi:hypothetical protein
MVSGHLRSDARELRISPATIGVSDAFGRGEVLADRVVEALAPTPARLPATIDLTVPPARASQGGKP